MSNLADATDRPISTPTSRMMLKRRLRRFVAASCTLTGMAALWRAAVARNAVRILAYHAVETPPQSAFSVSIETFESHMKFLRDHCHVISLDAYSSLIATGQKPEPGTVLLTFDDGYLDFLENAVPILEKYRLPAACFVIAENMSGEDPRFMSAPDLAELTKSDLITVGSHSCTHRPISELDEAEQESEILTSKARLEAELGVPIRHFCYPYGTLNDFDQRTTRILEDSDYALALTSVNGVNRPTTPPMRQFRTKIEWGDDLQTFARIVGGGLDAWFLVDYFLPFLQRGRRFQFRRNASAVGLGSPSQQ